MSTVNAAAAVPTSHTQDAQARVDELRAMRQAIPNFVFPTLKGGTRLLNSAASVPPEFVELTAMAVRNNVALVRGGGAEPAVVRDLMTYADAYGPVADELEALAHFIRHSIAAAKNKAGTEALTTYALAQRLAKQPETADLAPYVADMSRALGLRRKQAKAALAKKEAKEPSPVTTTTEPS
jgi:hypothetical protein